MHADYTTVAALPELVQERLLQSGDNPERLWAAWAIALRQGQNALPTLAALSDGQLTDGLKCQLIVVLAGIDGRNLLFTIGRTDPSADVRATATTYCIRTSSNNDSELTLRFSLDQLHTGIPAVVLAVLSEHEALRINLPDKEVTAFLDDPRLEIREGAISCLLSRASISESVRDSLLRALIREENAVLTAQIMRYLPRTAVPLLVNVLTGAPTSRIIEILDLLREKFGMLSWNELDGIIRISEPLVVDAALSVLDVRLPDAAIPWIGSAYKESKWNTSGPGQDFLWHVEDALRRSLTAENAHLLGSAAIALLHQEIQGELAYFSSASTEELEENDFFDEDGALLAKLLAILSTAASHV